MSDFLAVQQEIAGTISQKLRLRLSGTEKKKLLKQYTENTEAYQFYLKGRYYWNKRTEEGFKRAIELFDQAIEKDANYALAYAGLSDSYGLIGRWGFMKPREMWEKGSVAAMKALEIDNNLAEAHNSLAWIKYRKWDWSGTEREFKLAIALNPNYATAHHWYGYFLSEMGRHDEAIEETKTAQELDPFSLAIGSDAGLVFYFARQYDKAIEQYRRTLDMDPNFYRTHLYLGSSYLQKEMYQEAIAELEKAKLLEPSQMVLARIGYAYALSEKRDEARKALDQLTSFSKERYVDPYFIASVYIGLGEKDHAFAWLEKAYEDRSSWLTALIVEPMFDSLRSDPRFTELLKKVGLEK